MKDNVWYYAVIGNRDHIKIGGQRRPFWEFLDVQPSGFLSSLAYLPLKDFELPAAHKILDCGAWSYKSDLFTTEDGMIATPSLKKTIVSPDNMIVEYKKYAAPGDLVIAPDHMLIPCVELESIELGKLPYWVPLHIAGYRNKEVGGRLKHFFKIQLTEKQLNARRRFNLRSAEDFYELAIANLLTPMATVHGADIEEKVANVQRLHEIGYKHFSLGGMAAMAGRKKYLLEAVELISSKVRSLSTDAWIHVLGLSAPDYFAAFSALGIDSCDGSSHFKQAFSAKAFFVVNGSRLEKRTASTSGQSSDISDCACTACSKLRGEGIDTRQFGSNENNMGRAAHNLNMLMQAQKAAANTPVVQVGKSFDLITLVSCVGQKLAYEAPANKLYQSPWFLKARRYVESRNSSNWFVLSAKHGLIHRDTVIAPYDLTLNELSCDKCKSWADMVFGQILELFPGGGTVEFFAGDRYRRYLIPLLESAGYQIEVPLKGMGIGQQLKWFTEKEAKQFDLFSRNYDDVSNC